MYQEVRYAQDSDFPPIHDPEVTRVFTPAEYLAWKGFVMQDPLYPTDLWPDADVQKDGYANSISYFVRQSLSNT
jgi:hypothetical protein